MLRRTAVALSRTGAATSAARSTAKWTWFRRGVQATLVTGIGTYAALQIVKDDVGAGTSALGYPLRLSDGTPVNSSDYAGKVLLVVNVASS
mmetsp:Transcript_121385/g.278162  ORF Transcript_121385/g.278162 Transcript_121385/m.278162 type:complete len:91 (-) Transcript_121385:533-805(-)